MVSDGQSSDGQSSDRTFESTDASKSHGTMTATIVMMSAAKSQKKTVASYLAKQVSLLRFVQNMRMETHAVLFTLRSLTDECSALELIQAASSQNNFLNFILHFDLSKNNNRDWLFLFGVRLQFLFCFLFGMCFG